MRTLSAIVAERALRALGMLMLGIAVSLSAGATEGGGVTRIGIPFGMSIVYDNPGPYSEFQESPFGTEQALAFLNETATFLFPQYPARTNAPDTGQAFADDKGVFWAQAIKRNGASPDSPARDGVAASARWGQVFRKNRDSAWMTFTVTKAYLYVTRGPAYLGRGFDGSRAWFDAVGEMALNGAHNRFFRKYMKIDYATDAGWSLGFTIPAHMNCPYTLKSEDTREITCSRFKGEVDLSQIAVGEEFGILFRADAAVETSLIEGPTLVEATFRDPLDTGSGIVVEVEGLTPLDDMQAKPTAADRAQAQAIQADGRIIAVGSAFNGSDDDFALTRYNGDGSLDTTFGAGGKVMTDFANGGDGAMAVTVQGDGAIVVAGHAQQGAGTVFAIVRYHSDGSLDDGFGTGGKVTVAFADFDAGVHAVAVEPDGKIVAAGYAWNGTDSDFALLRLDASGALDTAGFGNGTGKVTTDLDGHADQLRALALQPDGRIVVAGSVDTASTGRRSDFALARYDADGSLDASFGSGGKVIVDLAGSSDIAEAVAIDAADGKIVAAGHAFNGVDTDFAVVRLDAAGNPDAAFGSGGKAMLDFSGGADLARALAVRPDGNLIVAGHTTAGTDDDFAIA
ncbi:MAG TPA: delta-60 repeat domain-containing protein, partial [Steroidobacteraceae bacterium]|nr:delta-60 repeat domain-containing protein [Steroidobacteraceae bacterium]